jgi:hypothetical protein
MHMSVCLHAKELQKKSLNFIYTMCVCVLQTRHPNTHTHWHTYTHTLAHPRALTPTHPNHSSMVPSTYRAGELPLNADRGRRESNRPVRGPVAREPTTEAKPPTMCTTPEHVCVCVCVCVYVFMCVCVCVYVCVYHA